MGMYMFAFRRDEQLSDFSMAERIISDTVTWTEISRQRLESIKQNKEEQGYA